MNEEPERVESVCSFCKSPAIGLRMPDSAYPTPAIRWCEAGHVVVLLGAGMRCHVEAAL